MQAKNFKYECGNLLKAESKEYCLVGLPLFNKGEENKFEEIFSRKLLSQ